MAAIRGQLAALALSSVVACALLWARARFYTPAHLYLPWNLALAWVPYALGAVVARVRSRWAFAWWTAAWLVFLPNAPYLVTDWVHFGPRPPVPSWLDALVFMSFASSGCALGWASLATVHQAALRRAGAGGRWRAHALTVVAVAASGFGVFLGRFERWNSWDLATRPAEVVAAAVLAASRPGAVGFSAAFALFVGAGYLACGHAGFLARDDPRSPADG